MTSPSTSDQRRPAAALYAVAGAGDLAVQTLRALPRRAQTQVQTYVSDLGGRAEEVYGDLAERGRILVERVRRQPETRELETQVKLTAQRTRAAATTVQRSATKARRASGRVVTSAEETAGAAAEAAGTAASKVGD